MLDLKGRKAKLVAGSRLTCGISQMLLICALTFFAAAAAAADLKNS
jgi:hypothetical protein